MKRVMDVFPSQNIQSLFSLSTLAFMVSDSLSNVLLATSAATLWHLWLARNNRIFQKVLEEPVAVFYKAQVAAFWWLKQRSKLLQDTFTEWCLMSSTIIARKTTGLGNSLETHGRLTHGVVLEKVQVRLVGEAPVLVAMVLLCGFLVEMV
ncbi:hypothetical protein Ancab_008714 [Ancistrocladus abbreviatus]